MAKSKSGKYLGIPDIIKDFINTVDKGHLTFSNLTTTIKKEYPDSTWKEHCDKWRWQIVDPKGPYYERFTTKEREVINDIFNADKYYKVTDISPEMLALCNQLIELALKYDSIFGKKLNVTGEIGEILVCHKLGLKMVSDGYSTFDAVDRDGKRVQIKARHSDKDDIELPKEGSTISKISHSFDYLILVILDRNYKMHEILKVSYSSLKKHLDSADRSTASIATIRKLGANVYHKSS